MKHKAVGRPARWRQPILDYVQSHGAVRALEIRQTLGIPRTVFYRAVGELVCQGMLSWHESDSGNYRLLRDNKTDFLRFPTSLLQFAHKC